MPMALRNALASDIDRLLELGRQMHQESSYAPMALDEAKLAELFLTLMDSQYLRVVEKDGQVVCGMLGLCVPAWFSQDKIAYDFALFVDLNHRGGSAAMRLIKDFIEWAKEVGATQIRLGVTTGSAGVAAEKMYGLLGLTCAGSNFYMNVR